LDGQSRLLIPNAPSRSGLGGLQFISQLLTLQGRWRI
jgi:hypothetical protein